MTTSIVSDGHRAKGYYTRTALFPCKYVVPVFADKEGRRHVYLPYGMDSTNLDPFNIVLGSTSCGVAGFNLNTNQISYLKLPDGTTSQLQLAGSHNVGVTTYDANNKLYHSKSVKIANAVYAPGIAHYDTMSNYEKFIHDGPAQDAFRYLQPISEVEDNLYCAWLTVRDMYSVASDYTLINGFVTHTQSTAFYNNAMMFGMYSVESDVKLQVNYLISADASITGKDVYFGLKGGYVTGPSQADVGISYGVVYSDDEMASHKLSDISTQVTDNIYDVHMSFTLPASNENSKYCACALPYISFGYGSSENNLDKFQILDVCVAHSGVRN